MSFWKRDSTREATDRASWSPVFGHTIGYQYSSHLLWTTLKSNTWARNIQYTSRTPLRKITLWQQNGTDEDTLASRWIGTTREDKSTYPCQTMSQNILNNSSTNYKKKQHRPYPSAPIIYGAKKQYATPLSTAPLLDKKGKISIQQVCEKFLFLGRAVDSTLLCPISAIYSQSETPTEDTMQQTQQLLYYIATQE